MIAFIKEMVRNVYKWYDGWLSGRPHFVIGSRKNPTVLRWYVWPRNPLCCLYIHKFVRSDDDRAFHDHPWPSVSLVLSGRYREHTGEGVKEYGAGSIIFRSAEHAHRIELIDGKRAWTLFLTGPRKREWGFHCPKGWIHWRDFTMTADHDSIGKGCDQ